MVDKRRMFEQTLVAVVAVVVTTAAAGIWNWASKGELVRIIGGVTEEDFANISVRISALETRDTILGLPKDTVVAFDRAEGCPREGWVEFKDADGRVIVGISNEFSYRVPGGEKEVTLREDMLPSHVHKYDDVYYASDAMDERFFGDDKDKIIQVQVPGDVGLAAGSDQNNPGWAFTRETNVEPSDRPLTKLNNMQPYIPLYFCKRT